MNSIQKNRLFLVKFGTEVLCTKSGRLDQAVFDWAATQIHAAQEEGWKIIIITSGAVQAGRERMKFLKRECNDKYLLAGIGSRHLLHRWGKAFGRWGMEIAQIWATSEFGGFLEHGREIKRNINICFQHDIVPVINHNDIVSKSAMESMKKGLGDNDVMARVIALLMKTREVLFLTNVPGVYNKDPRVHPGARMYREMDLATVTEVIKNCGGSSKKGNGGMSSKLREGSVLLSHARVGIAGIETETILWFLRRKPVGTLLGTQTIFA